MSIHFGTSGWRAVIADEFDFAAVGKVTEAICSEFRIAGRQQSMVIAHDTRFLGEQFAAECAGVVSAYGFRALLCTGPTPTPAVSYAIRTEQAACGINFTASHNPPEYNGMKLSTADGAPALPTVTSKIENLLALGRPETHGDSTVGVSQNYDPRSVYLEDLARKVRFDAIAASGAKYAYDPLWGTGRGYLDEVLRLHGVEVETIHDWRDVLFGGRAPEPEATHLEELRERVLAKKCTLGLATDGDGDRFGVIDSNGRVAHARGLPVYETPVGFKYIGELINADKIILGGEESAGLSIKGHYPEKDGILACLLAAEAVASRGATLTEQLDSLYTRTGKLESGRIGVRLTPELMPILKEKLKEEPTAIGGRKIKSINRIDGLKFIFTDDSWLLVRPSGTEPLVRIYAESESAKDLEVLLEQGRKYLLG